MTTAPSSLLPISMQRLETDVLPAINKPGRYLGLEQGAYRKPFSNIRPRGATMALAFPDLYEIGMSSYAIKLLYSVVNQHPNHLCDRVYAPDRDFKTQLAQHGVPLYGVESKMPLSAFDMVAFSLQYELNYTTVLGMLEAAQIPLRSQDRNADHWPIILGGGPGAANPMPMSAFLDGFMNGDGEDILLEILDCLTETRNEQKSRSETLQRLATIDGLYIPGYSQGKVYKRIVDIAERGVAEIAPLIPTIQAVHDRVTVEARRGCDRMCRFCQPGFINLPVREQNIETIKKRVLDELEKTGYEECSLLSLSIADYSHLKPLVKEVSSAIRQKNASLSLPSQRADRFNVEVAEAVQEVRKSTLTFAPEAGTARMRDVINKNLSDAEILRAVTTAYRSGWNKVKLYFMIGLPTETPADLDGIVDIVQRMKTECAQIDRDENRSNRKHLEVNITLSNFVPKPHTPFQWCPQDSMESLTEKTAYLRQQFRGVKGVKLNFTDPVISKLEGVISRGGSDLADSLELAYRKGAYLDAWDEPSNFEHWWAAMAECQLDPEAYTRNRCLDLNEDLPWDVMDVGLEKRWLQGEFNKAMAAASTLPCFDACSTCGVCGAYGTWPKFTELPPGVSEANVSIYYANFGKPNPTTPPAESSQAETAAPKGKDTRIRPSAPPVVKLRLVLQKKGSLRFVSHLDWMQQVQRALMRAQLPVAYTQGFNPKPKLSFSPALPLFVEALNERVDVDLTEIPSGGSIAARLNAYLPEEGRVVEEALLPVETPSIDSSLIALDYTVRWACLDPATGYTIKERASWVFSQPTLLVDVETKAARKRLDLAPYLSDFSLEHDAFRFQIRRQPVKEEQSAWIRPMWVLQQIDPLQQWHVTRTQLHLAPFATICHPGSNVIKRDTQI
ncbi:MAG: TIGR03960 family B12-binding radical SAM protein [Candidatus Melainabacteria bacterium]|nr:TIGR03960 family B12-binding radical SAM protein [Candidatus Melainabacteria bacterium]